MQNKFEKTSEDFYFYMVNTKEARDFTEVGFVKWDWLKKNMPGIEPHIKEHEDGITVIFTNNKGGEKFVMTPWIMAHRIAHAFQRYGPGGNFRSVSTYGDAEDEIDRVVDEILETNYGYKTPEKTGAWARDDRWYENDKRRRLIRRKFFEAIGTFRSARNANLREDFEFLNEIFAQYLITGSIKFNPPPKKIVMRKAWGNDSDALYLRDEDEDAAHAVDTLSRTLEYHVENMLSQAIGSIFVM
jgi:hypothetical protein